MKRVAIDLIIIFLLVVLIGVLIPIFQNIKSQEAQCISNPLQFGAEAYSKATKSELTCSCQFNSNRYAPFIVTRNSTAPISKTAFRSDVNYSGLNLTLKAWKD